MKKYKVFRSFGNVDRDIKKHVLVAVEYGNNIDDVTKELIRTVNDDATGLSKYQTGYTSITVGPKEIESSRRVKRYPYTITAILQPDSGGLNDLLEYGITEESTNDAVVRS